MADPFLRAALGYVNSELNDSQRQVLLQGEKKILDLLDGKLGHYKVPSEEYVDLIKDLLRKIANLRAQINKDKRT